MNQEELQQKIAEYYSKLPENLQQFFAGMNWLNTLGEINTKYGLNPEQIEMLSTETTLVLLGIIPMEDYVKILEQDLKISEEKKDEFLSELNEKIFKDIGYELEDAFIKNVNELSDGKQGEEKHIDERFSVLPKEVQKAISKSDYQAKLYKIAENHKLNVEQMGVLEETTVKLIINTIHPDQYEAELASKITLPKDEIGRVVEEVNSGVLKAIRDREKTITNYELGINNDGKKDAITNDTLRMNNEKIEDVPLPPYKTTTNNEPEIANEAKTITENKPKNILEEKIVKPTTTTPTISDYSTPKNIPKIEDIKRGGQADPYREVV